MVGETGEDRKDGNSAKHTLSHSVNVLECFTASRAQQAFPQYLCSPAGQLVGSKTTIAQMTPSFFVRLQYQESPFYVPPTPRGESNFLHSRGGYTRLLATCTESLVGVKATSSNQMLRHSTIFFSPPPLFLYPR